MRSRTNAFSLIEVVLALALFTFSIVTLIALLPSGLKTSRETIEETDAVNLLGGVIEDMRRTPPQRTVSEIFKLSPTPFSGQLSELTVHEAWFTESLILLKGSKSDQEKAHYKIEWWYVRVPDVKSMGSVEAVFRVSWPPKSQKTFGGGGSLDQVEKFEMYASFVKP